MIVAHYRSTKKYYRKHLKGMTLWLWLFLMQMKMTWRVVRDSIAYILRPKQRAHIRELLAGWRGALRDDS
jgi:hypothetical protein